MDTLHERLADLADEAPTGGAPAAELWARGKRTQRIRAAAVTAAVLVVGAVGTGVGARLADGDGRDDSIAPAQAGDFSLPIEYPVGEELPELGDTPGPLAAIWLAPREPHTSGDDDAGIGPVAVGLVAETGMFGTLPIELSPWMYEAPDAHFALSPDGRRIAYYTPREIGGAEGDEPSYELVFRDLVSGDEYLPGFEFGVRGGATWVDATHLVGHVAGGSDVDGWVWEPGKAPRLVNPYRFLEDPETDPPVDILQGDPPWSCVSPTIRDKTGRSGESVLCDVLGVIGSEILLGHWNSGDLNRAVIALNIRDDADFPFEDPALRRMVVTAGAPNPVTFATDLIAEALDPEAGAS